MRRPPDRAEDERKNGVSGHNVTAILTKLRDTQREASLRVVNYLGTRHASLIIFLAPLATVERI